MRVFLMASYQMIAVLVGYDMYRITSSPLWLGFIGLVQFLPKLLFLFPAGSISDNKDRRMIIVVAQLLMVICCLSLSILSLTGALSGGIMLIFIFGYGTTFAFQNPAAISILPNLVEREEFAPTTTKVSALQQLMVVVGPVIAGILITFGMPVAYGAVTLCNIAAMIMALSIRPHHIHHQEQISDIPDSPLEGLRYIWQKKGLFGAISMDLFAVLFGGAVALLPIFAENMGVGALGFGIMRACPAVGAVLMSPLLVKRPIRHKTGKILFTCVFFWGVATIFFALSTQFIISCALLVIMGALDMVSMVIRQTYVQLTTEDAVRGRVSAVNSVFIGASNQLGEFESGTLTALIGLQPAVVIGGFLVLGVTVSWYFLFPALRNLDRIE